MRIALNTEAVFFAAVTVLAAWVARPFIEPIVWSLLIAAATWPAYVKIKSILPQKFSNVTPGIATLGICAGIVVPLSIGADILTEKAARIVKWIIEFPKVFGDAPPTWISSIPYLGKAAINHWNAIIHPDFANALSAIDPNGLLALGGNIVGIAGGFAIFLMSLWYIYAHGHEIWEKTLRAMHETFGENISGLANLASEAICANMRGGAVLAVFEGTILSIVFAVSGHNYPFITGFVCGLLSPVPLVAPLIIGISAAMMAFDGNIIGAIVVGAAGGILIFLIDPVVRTRFGTEGTRLPFMTGIIGMFGGASAFGLIGIFIGPVILSVAVAVWKDWTSRSMGTK